jgi:hypothetical protein
MLVEEDWPDEDWFDELPLFCWLPDDDCMSSMIDMSCDINCSADARRDELSLSEEDESDEEVLELDVEPVDVVAELSEKSSLSSFSEEKR